MFSIIIPNYNGAQFLPNCLKSVKTAIENCPDCQFEIILVDNASTDNSVLLFKKLTDLLKIKNCKLKINSSNFGFAKAVNQGIMAAKNDWVVLLNNDLTMAPDWFSLISKAITKNKSNKYSCFCGTVLNKSGNKFESQGLDFNIKGKCNNISNNLDFNPKLLSSTNSEIWGSSAALVVYSKDVIKKIGLFDEDFFAYEEDVDLALRLNRLGYKTLYIPIALSFHLGGGTSRNMGNFRSRMDAKNWFFIIIKNYSSKEILSNLFPLIEERFRNLSGLIKNTSIFLIPQSIISTYGNVIKKIPSMLKKRKRIQILLKSKL